MTTFDLGLLPAQPVRESLDWITRAEDLGFDGVWIADSQSIFRDAFAALAACAVTTSRIRLATGVTNPVTRHPAVVAGYFATLDELSGGRAVMGIGVGASTVRTLGLAPARLAHLEKSIRAIRDLLAGEETEWDGEIIKMPWSQRTVPVVISCSGPKSLQLAGRIADGAMFQVGSHPELVKWAIKNIRSGAEQAGRDPASVELYMRLGCVVSPEEDQAKKDLKGYAAGAAATVAGSVPAETIPVEIRSDLRNLADNYDWYHHTSPTATHIGLVTDRLLDSIGVAGTPEQVVGRLQGLVELGVDGFVVPITVSDPMEQIALLAAEVVPRVGP